MSENYKERFKSCGKNVTIASDVFIESPEVIDVGDNVTFMRGFHMMGKPKVARFGDHTTFYPDCFIQGSCGSFIIEHNVTFYPGNYLSLGDWATSCIEIGHDSHFAPRAVLYGWGGLRFGPYCNIAAHVVFATVGHHDEITDQPMAFTGEKTGPITLEEDVWVCANATITANTRIARACVIGANAVVTRDTKAMGVYGGVPARRLRDR